MDHEEALARLPAQIAENERQLAELDSRRVSELEGECTALLIKESRLVQLCLEKEAELHGIRLTEATTKKGNADPLSGKQWITFQTARTYLGCGRRAIEIAAKKGSLITQGRGTKRRILTESLLTYLPPEKKPTI